MKKIALLLLLVILASCSKNTAKSENDYYLIIYKISPLDNEFIEKSGNEIYNIRQALIDNKTVDIEKSLAELNKVEDNIIKKLHELDKEIKSDLGKSYLHTKIEYIEKINSFTQDMLISFKNRNQITYEAFFNELETAVAASGKEIDDLTKIQDSILKEISKKVEK